jgi:hypothetical protein
MSKRLHSYAEQDARRKRIKRGGDTDSERNELHSFGSIAKLSDEILLNIFELLPLSQIIACQGVSHRWQELSTDPELWKRLYFLRFVEPRLAHVHSRTRTRIASRDWWNNERTHKDGEERKDWKHLFKVRHNWHNGRCAVSEMDILESSPQRPEARSLPTTSFWDEPTLPVSAPLVQFDGKIFIAADHDAGLRAWDIGRMENGRRKIIGSQQFHKFEQGWQLGKPTALGIGGGGLTTDVVLGFDSGGAMILRLDPSDGVEGLDFGFTLRYVLPPNLLPDKILHVRFSHPFFVTLDANYYLRAYVFESDSFILHPPRPLTTLHAQALQGPCNLTLRRPKSGSEQTITASIAYSMPILQGGWSVGIQEVVLDTSSPNGIGQTRIGTCIPPTFQLGILPDQAPSAVHSMSVPVASPTSISYSHPYLLTSHRDNTLTLYLARTTEKEISIGQPRRLWGHTTGVARAGVAGRGRAVSVSQIGGEVRVWELESIAAAVSKTDAETEDGALVGIVESVRVENASIPLRVGKEMYLDTIPSRTSKAVEWIGFDEEKVLVVTSDRERDKNVTLYDFTF